MNLLESLICVILLIIIFYLGYHLMHEVNNEVDYEVDYEVDNEVDIDDMSEYVDNVIVDVGHYHSTLDSKGGVFDDNLNELALGRFNGNQKYSVDFSNDVDLNMFDDPSSFAPTNDLATSLSPEMEKAIIKRQLLMSRGSLNVEVMNDLQDQLNKKVYPTKNKRCPKNLNPYGCNKMELEDDLKPYIGKKCYADIHNKNLYYEDPNELTNKERNSISETMGNKLYGLKFKEGLGEGRAECRTGHEEVVGMYGHNSVNYGLEL